MSQSRRNPPDDFSPPNPVETIDIDDPPVARRGPQRNPRPVQPNTNPRLHPNRLPQRSLVESLGTTVDDLRQLYTDFGLRPYRVFSVVVHWTGGRIGYGTEMRESELEILPTPKLNMSGVTADMKSAGFTENGRIRVTQISPNYTEDDIDALFFLQPLPPGHQGFWEVRIDQRDGQTLVRRFMVYGAPWRMAGNFEWRGNFIRQDEPFSRTGSPQDLHTPAEVKVADIQSERLKRW